jgi:hypothetical protein
MRATIRCRSFCEGMASISFKTEDLIKTLYSATPFQILDNLFKIQERLPCPLSEGGEILGVFRQFMPDRFVDDLRDGPLRRDRLQPQSLVDFGIQVNRGSSVRGLHMGMMGAGSLPVKSGGAASALASPPPVSIRSLRTRMTAPP